MSILFSDPLLTCFFLCPSRVCFDWFSRVLCLRQSSQANRALRTLCLAHIDYASPADLPEGYELDSPDAETMVLDAIVGIQDPLRGDVKEAVATAQRAGVMVS